MIESLKGTHIVPLLPKVTVSLHIEQQQQQHQQKPQRQINEGKHIHCANGTANARKEDRLC